MQEQRSQKTVDSHHHRSDGLAPVVLDLKPRTIVMATLTAVTIGVGFLFLYRVYMIVFLLFVAFSLATALKPIAKWFRQRKWPVALGVFSVYILGIILLVGFLWFIGPVIVEQSQMLIRDLPEYYANLRLYLLQSPSRLLHAIGPLLPANPYWSMQTLSEAATPAGNDSLTWLGDLVVDAGRIAFLLVAVFLLAYYWLIEGETTIRRLLLRTPLTKRDEYRTMIAQIEDKIGAYFRGQLLLCLIIGVLSLVAFWIIGDPNAITLAIISGITEAIPMIGPLIGAVPAVLTTLTVAPEKSLW
ncbi:MAG: AI-2E family transporter, partial [Caldilineaceae bacterium]|nr:AI-2E family transporter [Caldilineaceae bacterium]